MRYNGSGSIELAENSGKAAELDSVPSLEDRRIPARIPGVDGSQFLVSPTARAAAAYPDPFADGSTAVPLWLWWNILSADAPAVAAVWAILFARTEGAPVSAGTIALLALIVWLIYVFDRLLDGWRGDENLLRARHKFCAQHRAALAAMLAGGTLASVWLVRHVLTTAEFKSGLILSAIVSVYLVCVHLGGESAARWFPKEVAVGFVFALGTLLPVWSQSHVSSPRLWVSCLFFALLCTLNCVAIECWENGAAGDDQPSIVKLADSCIAELAAMLAAAALATGIIFPVAGPVCAALATSALLTLLLEASRRRLSGSALRVLADLALVGPALLALAIRL
jgi:hypothetical protein